MTHFRVKTPNYVPGFLNVMDKLFSEDFQSAFVNSNQPAVNITEKDKSYDITLMAPGLNKADFKIALEDNLLTISYEKQSSTEKTEESADRSERFIKKEFEIKSFKRSFNVNEKLNADEITASYENGLLTVSLPKMEEQEAKVKTININ
jgi:HSP20 family protein